MQLNDQLCFLLYVSSKEIIKHYTALLKPLHLTYTGFITLLALEQDEKIIVKQLGERLYLDSGTLTPLLKKLEEIGYVTRDRSKEDERQMYVKLTPLGKEVRAKLPGISEQIACNNQLSTEQYESLKQLLHLFVK